MSSFSFHRSDFGGDLPLSDQLKFQQTSGSVLRDHFNLFQPLFRCHVDLILFGSMRYAVFSVFQIDTDYAIRYSFNR